MGNPTRESLHDRISHAFERSKFIAIVLSGNFADSLWSRDELKQALARERRVGGSSVVPILCGASPMPAFLEDKVYIDFREKYYAALPRLAALVHGLTGVERRRPYDGSLIRFGTRSKL